ncbi:nucleotidyltransferase domain-containing protein [Bifidobacterium sp. MA2]|uniref:Nucleotidyltransferase domain-containing protein n=1 Tax=Bifidobacterium santillanense TaxID=2809028 RepID=A0ABS5URC4_9BIFI|nr:nucleotidyltransferase domain-containing protein [Bifidobacterium santillanense]MBT1173535.1 nucleotidyltransferase domain-containing protein [Bifidobacterium santillanense]
MTSAVDGLKQRFMELSRPDDDGVYRGGAAKRRARTELAMRCLKQLWAEAVDGVSFAVPDHGIGFAAVGSLARGQIGPSSDLDLVIIYDPHAINDQQLNELANKLWYPLWDSGLDLDHSIRTRQQCESVTDHDLPAAMGWLDVDPIAGDTALITETSNSILERWRKAARKRLPELLDSAKSRLDEFGRLQYLNQPDVKEARGGLRDSVLVSALAVSWLADRPHGVYDEAVERLLDVRDCIHLVANKDTNLLLTPYQDKVAAMLGLADPTLPSGGEREAKAIEDMQTMLARIGRRIAFSLDSTASRAEHSLTHEKPRFAFFQMFSQRAGGHREAPKFDILAPGVAAHEGEIVLAPGADPSADASLALRVALEAGRRELPINPGTLTNLRRCPIHSNRWDADTRALFVDLLACGPSLLDVWEEIDFADIPGKWMPEWLGIRNRPSVSAAHRYTIDRHTIEVVTRLGHDCGFPSAAARSGKVDGEIAGSDGVVRYDDHHYTALLLAGLLHDIGKRSGVADHAAEGARHAPVIARRMGFDDDTVRMVTLLVREHLTLSEFATGRDPNDPATGRELADRVGHDPVLLDMLYDLTRADGSSLGATPEEAITKRYGWSKWRETLARQMVAAVRAQL